MRGTVLNAAPIPANHHLGAVRCCCACYVPRLAC